MKTALRLAVAALILGVLFWIGDGIAAHWEVMVQLSPWAALLALLAVTAGRTVMAYKWLRLLRCRGAQLSLHTATQIYCAANIWGLFLPATVGADAVRIICTCREGLNPNVVVATTLLERGIGFIVGALLCVVAVLYLAEHALLGSTLYWTGWFATVLFVGLLAGLFASFSQPLFHLVHDRLLAKFRERKPVRMLRELHVAYLEFRAHRGEMVIFTGLTLVEGIVTGLAFWIIAWGLGIPVGPIPILAAVFLANLLSRVTLSVGDGLGVFEGMFVLAMAVFGMSTTEALSIALLGRVFKVLSWLPWWFTYTMRLGQFGVPSDKAAH
ncbi:lysylphosphatidylglycerol synthase transmembrane domain-containing protein [Aquisalimonas sp.]|uniref:lysylphosphatidylglycerol synthase transmembrane domain-containing protein n=1 Tax=Aquisalimonas sp. TaxID=1872621 RepID=UPI0025B7ADF9|nr:lysylphosphatidylglycerol synthase transmembrane domain-containing protein [Aquisalimonas sp.]